MANLTPEHFSQTEVHTRFEQDRDWIELRSKETDQTIIEFWDEALYCEVNTGFIRLYPAQRLHQDLLSLAIERGFCIPVSLQEKANGTSITPN